MLIDDLISKFPSIPETTIYKYFPMYENSYRCYYGGVYGSNACDDEIILHLLAHLIILADMSSNNSESIKQVSGRSVGNVSVSFAVAQSANSSDAFFGSTVYGQTYLMLTKKNIGAYFV